MKFVVSPLLMTIFSLPFVGCSSFTTSSEQGPYRSRVEVFESAAHESDQGFQGHDQRSRSPLRPPRKSAPTNKHYPRDVETFHMTLGVGQLRDDNYWQGLDEPWFFGLDYASNTDGEQLGAEVGFLLWGDSTSPGEEVSVAEIFAGLRYTANADRHGPHPYVGVGGTLIGAKLKGPVYDENDGSIGLYGHVGLTVPMGPRTEIGLDYRVVRGTESDFPGGPDSDFDYDRLALVIGWSF